MPYGMRVWDQFGELGTEFSDVIALAHFADYLPYTVASPANFIVIDGVPDRGDRVLVLYRIDFNGRYERAIIGGPYASYNAARQQLTLTNSISSQPATFFLVMSW